MEEKSNTIKLCVLYCRVSTKEQADEGNSLVTQERAGRDWAAKNGYEIARSFIERGESAKTADRPELQQMLKFCAVSRKNSIQAVVVYKLDRLARHSDDYSKIRLILRRYNVDIRSMTEFFEDTPAGRFMENIIANVAQFDNDVRAERSVGGMREAVREGRYVWWAPVGYRNARVEGKANIVPSEMAPLVREAFTLVASGQFSTREAWRITREHGLRTQSGRTLCKSYFYVMLQNEIYTGWITQFSERNKGAFEPLISVEQFAKVQRVLKSKGHKVKQYVSDNPDFPLRRFIKDDRGRSLTGSFSRGRSALYPFYRFGSDGSNFPRDEFDQRFMAYLGSFAFNDRQIDTLKERMRLHLGLALEDGQKAETNLRERLERLQKEEGLLVRKNLNGVISDDLLKREIDRIERSRIEVSDLLSGLEQMDGDPEEAIEFSRGFLRRPGEVWHDSDPNSRRNLQWFQFPSGIVFDGKKFGTVELTSLFKVRDIISDPSSTVVHHGRTFWNRIAVDCLRIFEILKSKSGPRHHS